MTPPIIRTAAQKDLEEILRLYRSLQPDDPVLDAASDRVRRHWSDLLADARQQIFLLEIADTIIASCVLAIIPNLTRNLRPYGLIENVITDPAYRKNGYGTRVLKAALEAAWKAGCYKVMLLTGRNSEEVFRFYEGAGFRRGVKTGFIAYPSE